MVFVWVYDNIVSVVCGLYIYIAEWLYLSSFFFFFSLLSALFEKMKYIFNNAKIEPKKNYVTIEKNPSYMKREKLSCLLVKSFCVNISLHRVYKECGAHILYIVCIRPCQWILCTTRIHKEFSFFLSKKRVATCQDCVEIRNLN